jgi:hypothetical protein
MPSHVSYLMLTQFLSRGSVDVPALLAEVARVREAATAAEASRVTAVLTVETFA